MKKLFEFECQECGEKFEGLVEFEEIAGIEETESCKYCKGDLKRVFTFGYGKFNGTGFTKSTT